MSRAIIIVKECADCPYLKTITEKDYEVEHHYCEKAKKILGCPVFFIPQGRPEWCPLPKAIGYIEEVGNIVQWDYDQTTESIEEPEGGEPA